MSDNKENINNSLEGTINIIDDIVSGDYSSSHTSIKDVLDNKVADLLNTHKQEVAQSMFSGGKEQ